ARSGWKAPTADGGRSVWTYPRLLSAVRCAASEKAHRRHHVDDLLAVERGHGDGRWLELAQRLERRVGRRAVADRVLHGLAVRQDLLAGGAVEVLDELLGLGRVLAGLEHTGAGDAEEGAGVLVAEVHLRHVLAVGTGLALVLEPVVVVDHAARDLAGVDRLQDGAVALVDLRVLLQPLEPGFGGSLTLEREHRAHDGLEVGTARANSHLALPLRL